VIRAAIGSSLILGLALSSAARADVSAETMQAISTPDSVDTRIGTLEFTDGAPSAETATAVYDHLDFTYAVRAFTDTFKGVSLQAILEGLRASASGTTRSSCSRS
jgi:hypothetical protein